jgi:hypothetical protein
MAAGIGFVPGLIFGFSPGRKYTANNAMYCGEPLISSQRSYFVNTPNEV